MKTYKQQAHELLQSHIRELRNTINTIGKLDPQADVRELLRQHNHLVRLSLFPESRTQLKKARRGKINS